MGALKHELVQDFVRTLNIAIFDRKIAAGNEILFYYDNDVLGGMVLGFEDRKGKLEARGETESLVLSLLSCNYLGPVHVLRPHLAELDNLMERSAKYTSQQHLRQYLDRVKDHSKKMKMEELLKKLNKAAEGGDERTADFLGYLKKNSTKAFTVVEQINGPWPSRFRRLWEDGIICFDPEKLGPEITEILEEYESVLHTFNAALHEVHKTGSRTTSRHRVQDLHDAIALTMLHKMVRDRDKSGKGPIVRFYTHSRKLKKLWKNEKVRELLSYQEPLSDEVPPEKESFIVRDSKFLIMCARFMELSPVSEGSAADAETRLRDLDYLSDQITRALMTGQDDLRETLEEVQQNMWIDRDVIKDIEEFENLSMMESLWVHSRLADGLQSHLRDWAQVLSFSRDELGEAVLEGIDKLQRQLKEQVTHVRVWTEDFKSIFKQLKTLRETEQRKLAALGAVEEVNRDLGLVRWGLTLEEGDKQKLKILLEELPVAGAESGLSMECTQLAIRLGRARQEEVQCILMSAFLWSISLWEKVIDLLEGFEKTLQEQDRALSPNLSMLRFAAKVKTEIGGSVEDKRKLLDEMSELVEDLEKDERKQVLLGVGYIYFHLWYYEHLHWESDDKGVEQGSRIVDSEIEEWAKLSFQAGEEAFQECKDDRLVWAFAINHCTYVGLVTGVEPEKTAEFYEKLLALRGSGSWNYRFDDTVGYHYLASIREEIDRWDRLPAGKECPDLGDKFLGARKNLERARNKNLGDIPTDSHLATLARLELKWNKARGDRVDLETVDLERLEVVPVTPEYLKAILESGGLQEVAQIRRDVRKAKIGRVIDQTQSYRKLAKMCERLEFGTADKVQETLRKLEKPARAFFKELKKKSGQTWEANSAFFVMMLLAAFHREEITKETLVEEFGWKPETADLLIAAGEAVEEKKGTGF